MAPRRPKAEVVTNAGLLFAGGQNRRTDVDPVTAKIKGTIRRTANAEPSGGGGGAWADPTIYKRKEQAEKKAGRKMTLPEFRASEFWTEPPADNFSRDGRGVRAIGTQGWVQDKIAEGDIEGGMASGQSGTSIFDPVLCELAYRWFCPPGGMVLDPFAGGSVRGIVASRLGRGYIGIDLSKRQVQANREQAKKLCTAPLPKWVVGDAMEMDKLLQLKGCDFILSCPPYYDLEVYSDDPRDLSTMPREHFLPCYERIIERACARLKQDRFACFVVGDARDKDGLYYGLPWKTVAAFEKARLRLYNEAVLVTAAGSLPIRVAKQFEASRKLGKTHQNVLLFCKGDPVKATQAVGEVEFGEIEPAAGSELAGTEIGGEV